LAFVGAQLHTFPIQQLVMQPATQASGKAQYQAQYQPGRSLNCQNATAELRCGVQNQALLDYIRHQPERLQQLAAPVVTFQRQQP